MKDYGLPKWPQMLVSGRAVTPDQAKEIIRRTDNFMTSGYGGNDHAWNRRTKQLLGMPDDDFSVTKDYTADQRNALWRKIDAWREAWGVIHTEYVRNSWLSCSFIGGPHGWCRPDGRIGFTDNVGKWPSAEDVTKDWQTLATAFPFLRLAATLMSGECCDDHRAPVCTILVRGGEATTVDGDLALHAEFGMLNTGSTDVTALAMSLALPPSLREHYPIPDTWWREWEARGREVAAKLA